MAMYKTGPKPSDRARDMRRNATAAESRLWQTLRNRQIEGRKFVRQAPVGPFFADFLCRELKLIIEIDGITHQAPEEQAYDRRRTEELAKLGYRVIRFTNADILESIDHTIELIRLDLLNHPSPSRA
jgi:very-short-patch-repair endonuclease